MAFNIKSNEGVLGLTKFSDHFTVTAASTNDNTSVAGDYIDRLGYESMKIIYNYQTVLTSAKNLTLQVKTTDCATSGGTYAAYSTDRAAAILCTADAGTATETVEGVLEYNVDLATADRYIKVNTCADLNNTDTDTAVFAVSVVLLGATSIPAS